MQASDLLTIGELSARSGVATSALRFYESLGLIAATRTDANHRRYPRFTLRTVALIRVAQSLGLTLEEIAGALRTVGTPSPTLKDWERLSAVWKEDLNDRINRLVRLREDLTWCIGCGCLSLDRCSLLNPDDEASALGTGPRYLLGDKSRHAE